ncbi:MAG: aldo/keto reductase [Thermoplasmata archaeon]|nr:aldo/keto reductase [Thermoplasmata archaeon]
MPLLEGYATPEGTGRFRHRATTKHRLPDGHFRVTAGGLSLSTIGLGTYIGAPDGPTDQSVEQAVTLCLHSGRINLIDTAINYRYQRAERSIGRGVARSVSTGTVQRDELFLATKNGYLAPDSQAKVPVDRWIEEELVKPGILRPADIVDGSHSMGRDFLVDQLERSRQNLGVSTIDLLYLHNAADAQLPLVGAEEFGRRLAEAFRVYEEARAAGKIVAYGLATWDCLRSRRGSPGHLSLEETLAVAREVGGPDHGFRFVQFPFNLVMPEAAEVKNQQVGKEKMTLFEAARRLGVGCFTSVPLFQGQLAREGPSLDELSAAQTAIQFARSAPGALSTLIGQKRPEHLAENLRVADHAPWDLETFREFLS